MKLTEGGKLERPNVCFLCETTPAIGSKVIDTERYFEGFPINLQGRRYVCQRCVQQMFELFDNLSNSQVDAIVRENLELQAIIRGIKLRLDEFKKDFVNLAENPNVFTTYQRESVEGEGQTPTFANEAPRGTNPAASDAYRSL